MNSAAKQFRDFVRLDFVGLRRGKGLILGLGAFFDDAGTHDSANVVSWGGLIGTVDQWCDLTDAWFRRLDDPFPGGLPPHDRLSKFHLYDCVKGIGEFAEYTEPERSNLQYEFRKIISDSGLIGICFSIDRKAYARVVPDAAKEVVGDAEAVCFQACFAGAFELARKHFPEEIAMALYFDRITNPKRRAALDAVVEQQRHQKFGTVPLINHVTFGEMVKYPPLQAADLIATEQCWFTQKLLGYPSPDRDGHFKSYQKLVQVTGRMMDEERIRQTVMAYGFEPKSS